MKIQSLSLILSLVLTAVVFSACSSELLYENSSVLEAEKLPAKFSGSVVSRGVEEPWDSDQLIGLFVKQNGVDLSEKTVIDYMDNKKYRYDFESAMFYPNTAQDTVYLPTKMPFSIIAYAPASVVSSDYKVPIDLVNQNDLKAIDYLYCNNLDGVTWNEGPFSLQFEHKLVKVKVVLQPDEGLPSDYLKGVTVMINDVPSKAELSLVDGNVIIDEDLANIQMHVSDDGSLAEAILLPGTNERHLALVTKTGDRITHVLKEQAWDGASQYTYIVTVSKASVPASFAAEITPWIVGDTIKVETENQETVQRWDGESVDTHWYSESGSTFYIYTASEFAGLASLINQGNSMEGKTFCLKRDIDLNNQSWQSIGLEKSVSFKGTLDGMNHFLLNLNITSKEGGSIGGLFMENEGTISNLIVRGQMVAGKMNEYKNEPLYWGGLVGINSGTIDHCVNYVKIVSGDAVDVRDYRIGGICGHNVGDVVLCQNYGQIEFGAYDSFVNAVALGGVVGYSNGSIKGCMNFGYVVNRSSRGYVGGIAGLTSRGSSVKDCTNYGFISSIVSTGNMSEIKMNAAGGVCGGATNDKEANLLKIENCFNEGRVEASSLADNSRAGGIVGAVMDCVSIEKCVNKARGIVVCNTSYVGGIVGFINTDTSFVYSDCSNGGIPLKWIGSDTSLSYKGGVTDR